MQRRPDLTFGLFDLSAPVNPVTPSQYYVYVQNDSANTADLNPSGDKTTYLWNVNPIGASSSALRYVGVWLRKRGVDTNIAATTQTIAPTVSDPAVLRIVSAGVGSNHFTLNTLATGTAQVTITFTDPDTGLPVQSTLQFTVS